ncbi:MAG: aldose epimerase family protein [Lysobacterales bacterium]
MTLKNDRGVTVDLAAYGAAIQSIHLPLGSNRGPRGYNAALGHSRPEDYADNSYFCGATIGRYAGRIANATSRLNGQSIQLSPDPHTGHCLHGGPDGFSNKLWRLDPFSSAATASFSLRSNHGDQGFPGTLDVSVGYEIHDLAIVVELIAMGTDDTLVSLTNHAYFNLGGSDSIEDHRVRLNASNYLPANGEGIATGEIRPVIGTPYNFRNERSMASVLHSEQGLDHTFVRDRNATQRFAVKGLEIPLAATVFSPATGLTLNVYSTQPTFQFYGGGHLGSPFQPHQGFCIEPQAYPDSANHNAFPTALLPAGKPYRQFIVYEFELSTQGGLH